MVYAKGKEFYAIRKKKGQVVYRLPKQEIRKKGAGGLPPSKGGNKEKEGAGSLPLSKAGSYRMPYRLLKVILVL